MQELWKVLFQEMQEWKKKFKKKSDNEEAWSTVKKLENSVESRKGLLQRKSQHLNPSTLRACGTEGWSQHCSTHQDFLRDR